MDVTEKESPSIRANSVEPDGQNDRHRFQLLEFNPESSRSQNLPHRDSRQFYPTSTFDLFFFQEEFLPREEFSCPGIQRASIWRIFLLVLSYYETPNASDLYESQNALSHSQSHLIINNLEFLRSPSNLGHQMEEVCFAAVQMTTLMLLLSLLLPKIVQKTCRWHLKGTLANRLLACENP